MAKKDIVRLVAIFVAALVILAVAFFLLDRELTLLDVVVIAGAIAIVAIVAIRLAAVMTLVRDL